MAVTLHRALNAERNGHRRTWCGSRSLPRRSPNPLGDESGSDLELNARSGALQLSLRQRKTWRPPLQVIPAVVAITALARD
jgi:hypothetical protein